jgi:hypothetical protein
VIIAMVFLKTNMFKKLSMEEQIDYILNYAMIIAVLA